MRMLIVDDSKAMRGFLGAIASELSFKIVEAEDGRHGLDVLINCEPDELFDVALIDWDMPRMNGIELIELIRRNRDFDSMKIMMVTINNSVEKMGRALAAGADDFMMKPVTKEALMERLEIIGRLPELPLGRDQEP